jgi:2-haloacid dehalogenase
VRNPSSDAIGAVIFDTYGTLFDTHSVISVLEAEYPGRGEYLTQIWRLKQLEYTWLRALGNDYRDFGEVTREALHYSLSTLGKVDDATRIERLADAYNQLSLFPDALPGLHALAGRRLAVLSNGSPQMLDALLHGAHIADLFEAVISVDAARTFKPDPDSYQLACDVLNLQPAQVLLVSSNGFDIQGAARFGLKTARIERFTADALRAQVAPGRSIGPAEVFRALRTQLEGFGAQPDIVVGSLPELAAEIRGM